LELLRNAGKVLGEEIREKIRRRKLSYDDEFYGFWQELYHRAQLALPFKDSVAFRFDLARPAKRKWTVREYVLRLCDRAATYGLQPAIAPVGVSPDTMTDTTSGSPPHSRPPAEIAGEGSNPVPGPGQKRKRSTESGEGRSKLIAALTKHHQYADGSCLNLDPIGNNGLAKAADVSPSTASLFFRNEFHGHTKYKSYCRNADDLALLR
jgi:hypothetical protein